jgi:NhaA family Na+:H+ antiporter
VAVGFTVSIFVSGLAFTDQGLQDEAKVGVLVASVVAATVGSLVLLSGQRASDAAVSTRNSARST